VPNPARTEVCVPGRTTRRFFPRLALAASGIVLVATAACDDPVPPPPEPASILLDPTTAELMETGETVRIKAAVIDENGDTIPDVVIDWASSDTLVATVSATGVVRALESGTVTVTATAGLLSAEATVTVVIDKEREALVAFYEATGGADWNNTEGWLSDDPVSEWYGVGTGGDGKVVELSLNFNGLSGALPAEIGDLTQLRELYLYYNGLTGSIPPEIGNLGELREMGVHFNDLSGSIPPELGDLGNLTGLGLHNNRLTGPIPAELGNLASLELLYAENNELSGEIPPELGNITQLTHLRLGNNELSGPFPVGLTRLPSVESVILVGNPLSGPLPDEVGDMASLEGLVLANTGLEGLLPLGMTSLRNLSELILGGTKLCAPDDDGFRAWLERVRKRRIPSCEELGDGSAAYLTQAVQSREYPVPLVAGEEALLRVFAVAPRARGDTIPLVRATFYLDGEEEVVEIEPGSSLIGDDVNEGSLNASANVVIEASLIQPGLEMVVEIDPDTTMDPELGVMQRIPETGRASVEVRQMPALEFTLIPFLWEPSPDSTILEITEDLSTDDELLWDINTLLPVGEMDLEIHDPVESSSNSAFSLLSQTGAIRTAENGTGYFMGTMSGRVTGAAGVAYVPGWYSFSIPDSSVMAHELGHNMSLLHAPCGGAGGPDPSFPQSDGSIGAWGYNLESGELVNPAVRDLMTYCDPTWVSEFYFTNSLRYRLAVEVEGRPAPLARQPRSLLIWGGTDPDGVPFLEPVFVIDARPALPRSGGSHRLTGADADGVVLFTLDFEMPVLADADGRGSFTFSLPVQPGWADALARVTLSGPGGSVTLDGGTDRPAAIVRDPRTGQVRGIFTDMSPGTEATDVLAGRGFEPGVEVYFSRGIPDAAAWRR